jgi:hypothetical protein
MRAKLSELLKSGVVCGFLFLSTHVHATGWAFNLKIVAVYMHSEGSVSIDVNQIVTNGTAPNSCALKSSVLFLTTEPNGQPRNLEKMARIVSMLLAAQARNATIGVYIERDDCLWGNLLLGAGGVQVVTN